jgi:hypothetical protein
MKAVGECRGVWISIQIREDAKRLVAAAGRGLLFEAADGGVRFPRPFTTKPATALSAR